MAKKLEKEIQTSLTGSLLPTGWPKEGKRVVANAARTYHHRCSEPFAVPDVLMDEALDEVNTELTKLYGDYLDDASDSWIDRYEDGTLDDEIKKAIRTWSQTLAKATPKM